MENIPDRVAGTERDPSDLIRSGYNEVQTGIFVLTN